jgi:Nuclease A inhibitor-like protein
MLLVGQHRLSFVSYRLGWFTVMKSENIDLVEELTTIAENLVFGEDGSISPFIWEVAEKGVLSAYNLVRQNRVWDIPSLDSRDFQEFIEGAGRKKEEYQALYEVLESRLAEFEFYIAYYPDEIFCLYTGRTSDGDWIGVCSGFEIDAAASFVAGFETPKHYQVKSILPSQAALQLISSLEDAGFSQAKLPVWDISNRIEKKKYIYEVAQQKEEVLEKLLTSAKFLVIQDFGEGIGVLASQFYDLGDNPQRDYKNLDRVLESKLKDLRVYLVGLCSVGEFDIYVIGSTATGDYAGVLIDVTLNP